MTQPVKIEKVEEFFPPYHKGLMNRILRDSSKMKIERNFQRSDTGQRRRFFFSAEHKEELIQALQIDTYEPPMTQVLSLILI